MALSKFSNLDLIDKPDCIGLRKNGRCTRLKQEWCSGTSCPFKRTPAEEAASERRALERLAALDKQAQHRIAKKYYDGNPAWITNMPHLL